MRLRSVEAPAGTSAQSAQPGSEPRQAAAGETPASGVSRPDATGLPDRVGEVLDILRAPRWVRRIVGGDSLQMVAVGAVSLWITYVYVLATFAVASGKNLWMDEALAVSTARLPSYGEIASAIWKGAEFSPPAYHFFLHALMNWLPGVDPLLLPRLPSIVAVFVAAACVYALVRGATDRLVAVTAFALTLDSGLFAYAVQARQYALIAAGLAGALVLWSAMDDRRRATLRAALLWALLAICVSLHFYGFVAPATIGFAEIVWMVTRRELRPRVWIALLAVTPVVAAWLPLGLHLKTFVAQDALGSAYNGAPSSSLLMEAIFQSLVSDESGALLMLAALAICGCAYLISRGARHFGLREGDGASAPQRTISKLEIAVLAVFLLPFVAYLFSLSLSSTFAIRYAAAASLFPALFFGAAVRNVPYRGAVACLLLPLAALSLQGRGEDYPRGMAAPARAALVEAKDPDLPIVIGEGSTFVELTEAADPAVRRRLYFLVAPPGVAIGDPTFQNQVKRLADIHPNLQVREEQSFLSATPCFYVLFRPEDETGTILSSLIRQKLLGRLLKAEGGLWLAQAGRGCRPSGALDAG